ncbi:hypothetical protein GY45DRAFT_1323783 [Cubamyces sp. BRFM 1775]|nr:hypothetical protein GY45DRAFT_1323783 [Cubamyces sp. BRFM 1775]
MILPDDTPQSPTKSRAAAPLSDVGSEEFAAPPPAYPGNASSQRLDQVAESSTPQAVLVQHDYTTPHHVRSERASIRFLKALGIGLLVWIVIVAFARSAFAAAQWRIPHPPQRPGNNPGVHEGDIFLPRPLPADGKVERCVRASSQLQARGSSRTEAVASFSLPLHSDALYIFARGSLARGSINLLPADDGSVPMNTVQVDITTTYEAKYALDMVNICLLERRNDQRGIGILTPSEDTQFPSPLNFRIDVRFPITRNIWDQVRIKSFETDLPHFQHTISDLIRRVYFDSISLSSRNMPIHSDYLAAKHASLTTSSARITGNFNVSRSLFLKTSNDAINTDIALGPDDRYGFYFTNLTILNSNSPIDARVALYNATRHFYRGNFDVLLRTSNAPLSLNVTSQPRNARVLVYARTENAPAAIALPTSFEGTYQASTTNGRASVQCDAGASDPTGNNRERVCELEEERQELVKGWTTWGRSIRSHGDGDVNVFTTNSPVSLTTVERRKDVST